MAVIDIKKTGIGFTVRKKLKRDLTIYPKFPYRGGGWNVKLTPGIYQMRPRPYVGKNYKHPRSGHNICVCMKFYQPSNQTQPKKVARQIVFASAISAWQALSLDEKKVYNKKASGKHYTGYCQFLHEYLISH
jgi:hypothetical protein